MDQHRLGASDLVVSRVGLGCNNFGRRLDLERARAVIDAAVGGGITFLDTADVYGSGDSERFIGETLAGRSEPVVVATKFGNDMQGENGDAPRGSREYMRRAVDASLGRLRRDPIDLLYYHRPDGITPLEETLGEMHELVVEGKVRWLGLSNVGTGALETAAELAARGSSPVVAVQNHFSLLNREDDAVVARAAELGIGYIPYYPLESGLLTGKYRRGQAHPEGARLTGTGGDRVSDHRIARMEELEAFAEGRGHTILELAIGGLASIPGVASVIAGATSPEQARANAAAGAWHLDAAELDELAAV